MRGRRPGFPIRFRARFYDRSGAEVAPWGHLMGQMSSCVLPRLEKSLVGLYDVASPLLGKRGCIRLFGEQKDLLPQHFEALESDLTSFADVVSHNERC